MRPGSASRERGRVDQLTGDHRDIVLSVNDILDAMIGRSICPRKLGPAREGHHPQKITATYNGDFNIIKNNLNACIAELSGWQRQNKVCNSWRQTTALQRSKFVSGDICRGGKGNQ